MRLGTAVICVCLLMAGCKPAERYVARSKKPAEKEKEIKITPPPHWAWLDVRDTWDVPIVFVPSTSPEWSKLRNFWNFYPAAVPGTTTLSALGQHPLGAALALVASLHAEAIKIKVPRGLPDPAPFIPSSNPPTYAKWKLGKKIFFEDKLLVSGADRVSCAFCHQPTNAFCDGQATSGGFNTLSLINVVYNKRQFWDGRVRHLEQTIVRDLKDEPAPGLEVPADLGRKHIWAGLVPKLDKRDDYVDAFRQVFGTRPTLDTISKALATYTRTILSGSSLYDWAEYKRGKAARLKAEHFEAYLDAATLKGLEAGKKDKSQVAQELLRGSQLFQGKGRCALCHKGPLFTDGDFHNIGIIRGLEDEPGYFAHAPLGLKETRLIGAFRTPSLRNLSGTAPYFHDGSRKSLKDAVAYYVKGIFPSSHLAKELREGPNMPVDLNLDADDIEVLALFLRSLDGEPVDAMITAPPRKE